VSRSSCVREATLDDHGTKTGLEIDGKRKEDASLYTIRKESQAYKVTRSEVKDDNIP